MKYAILGAGNIGKGNSAYLAEHNEDVILYDRDPARLEPIRAEGLHASGVTEGILRIPVTCDLEEAVKDAEIILVCTVAAGHKPIAKALKGLLRHGQIILVTNCCWGALEFDQELHAEAAEKGVRIAETSGQLILCSSPSPESVYLKSIKNKILLACANPRETGLVLDRLSTVFPQFEAAGNIIETSINNANPVTHGVIALFNITRIENGEDFLLFRTGVTPRLARFMSMLDMERVATARACGIHALTGLEMLNSFWPEDQKDLYDVFHKTASYAVTKGPGSLDHRYLSEDLPYGLAPILRLAKKFGIETPYLETVIRILSLYMEEDYSNSGPDVESANLTRYI